mmetsp:Transcript_76467/g.199342  ORF Transcript_76467/g.199342 Transcript_76467/m.199342 type:complete len:309 (+) Transcript_76467:255-1181(+)
MICLVNLSTASLSFTCKPCSFRSIFSVSLRRIFSAIACSAARYGTAPCEAFQSLNLPTSSPMSFLAFKTSDWRFSALACTTCLRSSTEYDAQPLTSEQSSATFLGTAMSTSMIFLPNFSMSALVIMGSLAPVAAKTTSLSAMTSHIWSIGATLAFLPPRAFTRSSASISSALSTDLFTTVNWTSGSLLNSASARSLDILPAPRTQTLALAACLLRSRIHLDIHSSTAALDTDTEPLPILVRVRTSLPMRMPAFNILDTILPPEPATTSAPSSVLAFSMQCSWHAFTCARICASPSTNESSPEDTSNRC